MWERRRWCCWGARCTPSRWTRSPVRGTFSTRSSPAPWWRPWPEQAPVTRRRHPGSTVSGSRGVAPTGERRGGRRREDLFRAGRYDLVHVQGGLVPTFGLLAPLAAWRVGIPVVATFHSWFPRSAGYRLLRRLWQPQLDRHAALIAVSQPVVDAMSRYFHARWEVIPNGVDVQFFQPNGRRPTDAL